MTLRYAMDCSSKQNRGMEAHCLLKRQGFDVSSNGTGAHVKLPGPFLREPNVYDFGSPYKQMFEDLRHKHPELSSSYEKCAGDQLRSKRQPRGGSNRSSAYYLCQELEATESWEDSIDEIMCSFEKQHRRRLKYSISFY